MVRRCYSFSQVTKKDSQCIRNELEGYQQEQRQNLPPYRIVKVLRGRSSSGTRVMEDYRVSLPVPNIERGASKGLGIFLPSKDVIRSGSEQQVTIESIYLMHILDSVKDKALELVKSTIVEYEYGSMLSDIFVEYKQLVDRRLLVMCPEAIVSLTKAYRDLVQAQESIALKQVAFACRDVLQEFADSLYKEEYLPQGESAPKKEQYMNKIRYSLRHILTKDQDTERELFQSLLIYMDKLNDLVQKDVHGKIGKEDANRCIIYTYLFMGDILKMLPETV